MRILYDSKQAKYKSPFGTLTPGQECALCIHIPASVRTVRVECVLQREDGTPYMEASLLKCQEQDAYEYFRGHFALDEPGLFFYYFRITTPTHSFRLFKYGDDTNMEDGDLWQLSCVPEDFTVPGWAQGAVIYQIFPDRFYKTGDCDLSGKLQPYVLHENWDEELCWQPTEQGEVLNNDFYGGNFRGIAEKLDYLASLGTELIYLNPISKSFSSHRYDTGDYKTPDPMLGTMEDFSDLCRAAHERGIRILLDGVFSHTGSNSLYFDRERTFGGNGAYCTKESPYYSWYSFQSWPDKYRSWWGFDTLPTVNKMDRAFIEYIITGQDSVIAHWLRAGCDGFRLDVADELPAEFLLLLKQRLRQLKPDALLMGEVWEDASNKISYGKRCRYFTDGVLDSVMNYPFRTAILNFVKGIDSGEQIKRTVMTIAENYPQGVLHCNMNHLGTHDTPRILTALVDDFDGPREEAARRFLSPEQRSLAQQRLLIATALQFFLPGSPSIYYGDEAGMEGHKDPFNRRTFPWGQENADLQAHFRQLGALRKRYPALKRGDIQFLAAGDHRLHLTRSHDGKTMHMAINCGSAPWELCASALIYGRSCHPGEHVSALDRMDFCFWEE